MTMTTTTTRVVVGDVSPELDSAARHMGRAAWDIETSGLDWRFDRIATCQLNVPGWGTEVIRVDQGVPERLRDLLASERVMKVFHHAPFDLRFMRHHWKVLPRRVACTKILSKIVHPELEQNQHSLKPLLLRYLDVHLDKSQQVSDWLTTSLTDAQVQYAAGDVAYLFPLFERLMEDAVLEGVADLVETSFQYLPTRIETDLRGAGDVFAY